MKTIYLDNAATSFPKPIEVVNSISDYMINCGGNPSRGSSSLSLAGNRAIFTGRETIAEFFNFEKIENVIFTQNITMSLNIILRALIKDNWHVITSTMDHNSVLRPLNQLKKERNISLDIIEASKDGFIDPLKIKEKINENTKAIVLSHGSNLCGSIQPLKEIGAICKEKNIFFIVDSAQTAGIIPINIKELNINALAFTGHKSLFGPQGIGGFILDDKINEEMSILFSGGTGSSSYSLDQPLILPDKFESGTPNTPGIIGLTKGIEFIKKEGLNTIKEKEETLCKYALEKLLNMDSVTIYGSKDYRNRTSTIPFNLKNIDSSELGFALDSDFNIITRTGLHCAPLAHKTLGSFPNGSVRISLGYFNETKDIDFLIDALNKF
ncbi:MAG: aminotransferase class V-fold PLP-dependent enzyme [Sarcina sp.]